MPVDIDAIFFLFCWMFELNCFNFRPSPDFLEAVCCFPMLYYMLGNINRSDILRYVYFGVIMIMMIIIIIIIIIIITIIIIIIIIIIIAVSLYISQQLAGYTRAILACLRERPLCTAGMEADLSKGAAIVYGRDGG